MPCRKAARDAPSRFLLANPTEGNHAVVEKVVELIGTSSNSIEDAVELAISRASVTLSSISEVELVKTTALVEEGRVQGWRVRCKVTFEIENRIHE
jgi:hypothetical protein